jgi:uncharacterized protein (TIGR02231 family)
MRKPSATVAIIVTSLLGVHHDAAARQDQPARPFESSVIQVDAAVSAVTLYRGRGAVTRVANVDLAPGVYDLHFPDLPATVQSRSLQVRTADGLKVLSVDDVQKASADAVTSPEIARADQDIKSLEQALRGIADQRELIKSQEDLLAALTIRTTSDAAMAGATTKLDLDAVKQQMEFITVERKRLQAERAALDIEQPTLEANLAAAKANRQALGGDRTVSRMAIVSVAAPESFKGNVALTYLVTDATWEPTYNVRAAADLSSAQIEYDAILEQRTGEDWTDVRLVLSTAQPTIAASPPALEPWYIDLASAHAGVVASRAPAAAAGEALHRQAEVAADKERLNDLASDAQVAGGGPSVTFELPRPITVKTHADRHQTTRIATINTSPMFVHVATPLLTEAVYLRGDLANSSAYHFLPGRAAIFLGQDYIGPTAMPSVAPGSNFKMHFGIDQTVRARRQLAGRVTESTGLLSGGRRTTSDYRIAIDNASGRNLTLEVWDRIPVSRNEQIQVQLIEPNISLASDAYYTAEQQPQGLLKWWLSVPAGASERNAFVISWSVQIDRAKDVQVTPLPD